MTTQYRKIALGFSLFILLTGIYILFYRGHPLSIDEVNLFDSVNSFVYRGTLAPTITFHRAVELNINIPPQLDPLYEPLQVIAASPLLWLAHQFPNIGQFHTVLLLNIFVTALTGVSIYFIATQSGYSLFTSWSAALLFGIGTLALPYSRSLFREPLMGLFTLWAFFMASQIRENPTYRRFLMLSLSLIGMISTKQVGFLFLPGIALCLMPYKPSLLRKMLPGVAGLGFILVAFLLVMFVINPNFGDDRYSLQRWLNPNNWQWNYSLESLLGYQISPSRSFWVYSPLLLLGLWGTLKCVKHGKNVLMPVGVIVTLLLSSTAYGALRLDSYWNGGASWGPRYMVPLIPVWMLLMLPVLKDFRRYRRVIQGLIISLILASVTMQLLGIAIPYSNFFFANSAVPTEWSPQNWSWLDSHIVYNLRHLGETPFDVAWHFADTTSPALAMDVLLIAGSLATSMYILKNTAIPRKWVWFSVAASSVFTLAVIAMTLVSLQKDDRYIVHRPDIFDLVGKLNSSVQSDDVMIIDNADFTIMLIFMNWFKPDTYYLTLSEQPESEAIRQYAVNWATTNFKRLWFITRNSRYLPVEARPLEYNLATALYSAGEIDQGDEARALLLITGLGVENASPIALPTNETHPLTLVSVTAPALGRAGELFPVTLNWTLTEPMSEDVCVSLQLYGRTDEIITQHDSLPQGNLGLTSQWQVGTLYADRHALTLPTSTGTDQLRVVVYDCQGEALHTIVIGDLTIE